MSSQNIRVEDNKVAGASASQSKTVPVRKRRTVLKITLVIIAGLLAYTAYDLLIPRTSRMRSFDPDEVARLDTAMWRSYYARQQVKLYNQMTELLRTQYNLPFVRSNTVAYQAARAAFVFKGGHSRQDYEKALPYLVSFYTSLHKVSDIPFDIHRAAKLELEWWIIHRERDRHPPGDLERALADLSGELYQMPAERFSEYARLRAEAMTIRDTKADQGGVTEADWSRIDALLHQSWQSLFNVVNG
ncbi:MAG TPA: hypothetical protein VN937_20360 [Blastocatellia bacterium]|nr:hypothetical protein [Blastocatellia bacterium]